MALRDDHDEFIPAGFRRPETTIEHPMGIGGQGQPVARVVVAVYGVRVDRRSFDPVLLRGIQRIPVTAQVNR